MKDMARTCDTRATDGQRHADIIAVVYDGTSACSSIRVLVDCVTFRGHCSEAGGWFKVENTYDLEYAREAIRSLLAGKKSDSSEVSSLQHKWTKAE